MPRIKQVATGFMVGSALTYFYDRARGRQRRARLRDLAIHVRREQRDLFGKARRDASHRIHGVVERARRQPLSGPVPDEILDGRVRAQLGRSVSHPHAIELSVRDGIVALRGPILAAEAEDAVSQISRVHGVSEVLDQLERHEDAGRHPSLQGTSRVRRNDLWTPAARGAAITSGAALAAWGLSRRSAPGLLAALAGSAVALRGVANQPFSRLRGLATGRSRIEVNKTIFVRAPIERVFELWSKLENFPRFMQHVQDIRVSEHDRKQTRWTIEGPAGMPLTFDAELVRYIAERELAWRTLPGERIEHAGSVRFEPTSDGTRIHIQLSYRPPGGIFAHALAHLLRWDPKARIDDDLVRMKALLESGRTRAHGERVALADFS